MTDEINIYLDSSRQPAPSPSLCYSLTHAHRSIVYLNHNPQTLADSTARLMYLRVCENRDISRQTPPSPSLSYSLTHQHTVTGPLVITTATPSLWLIPPRDISLIPRRDISLQRCCYFHPVTGQEKPLTGCGWRKFQIDPLGDHLCTCTDHSGAKSHNPERNNETGD
jgi:hypothetical protein